MVTIAWDLCLGGCFGRKLCVFSGKVAAADDEGQLPCEAVVAAVIPDADRFLFPVLQRVVAHVFVVIGCFGICACRSQCNGCMIVAMLCCHVRRYMRVCDDWKFYRLPKCFKKISHTLRGEHHLH